MNESFHFLVGVVRTKIYLAQVESVCESSRLLPFKEGNRKGVVASAIT